MFWWKTPSRSEIRFVGRRERGVLSVIIFVPVLGADMFVPDALLSAPIGDSGRPRHGEDIWVLDGKLDLQPLALVIAIDEHPGGFRRRAIVFPLGPLRGLFRDLTVDEAIALHHVPRLAMRRAVLVDHGERRNLDAAGIDHQRVA